MKAESINVNCVMPGTIDTLQNHADMPNGDHATWVPPAQIAEVIGFFASDAAHAITGAAVPVMGSADSRMGITAASGQIVGVL